MSIESSGRTPDTVMRVVHLIRHAEYDAADVGERLTRLGRQQALCVAELVRRLPIDRVASSDFERARATARVIAQRLQNRRVHVDRAWREIIPSSVPDLRVPLRKRQSGKAALEHIVATLLRPGSRRRVELVVSHGNLIRALVCRVLLARDTAWIHLNANHCSITTLTIHRSGRIRVKSFGDTAHLVAARVAYSENIPLVHARRSDRAARQHRSRAR